MALRISACSLFGLSEWNRGLVLSKRVRYCAFNMQWCVESMSFNARTLFGRGISRVYPFRF